MSSDKHKVVVVGSGVAGLTAAWVLSKDSDVTLYEADSRLGGHADTHSVTDPEGRSLAIDTGFIVHNDRTYPTLLRLFAELDVPTQESDMSMSVRCGGCGLEYSGGQGLRGVLPTPGLLVNGSFLSMLMEVKRFHRRARALLDNTDPSAPDQTLGVFLRSGRFSDYFTAHFMTPLVSAVWSCDPGSALKYPARYLFSFLDHHGMLSVTGSPTWRTVTGGSGEYVRLVAKSIGDIRLNTPVRAIHRFDDRVDIRDGDDQDPDLRRSRGRNASAASAEDFGGSDACRIPGPRRNAVLRQPHPASHRRKCAARQHQCARVVELLHP